MDHNHHADRLGKLIEREKELNCIYQIENLLTNDAISTDHIMKELVNAIPPGWQYPEICKCRVTYEGMSYTTDGYSTSEHIQSAEIIVGDHVAGGIEVVYIETPVSPVGSPFLPEEQRLLNTIAGILGMTIFRRKLKSTLDYLKRIKEDEGAQYNEELILNPDSDRHWKWRYDIVSKIASKIDLERFGLKGLYLIGSTKNANAGPGSDIDLLAHSDGNTEKNEKLRYWLEGWGYCLSEMNFSKSGYRSIDSLIDLHIVTDDDISRKNSYAILINAISDRARPLKIKN